MCFAYCSANSAATFGILIDFHCPAVNKNEIKTLNSQSTMHVYSHLFCFFFVFLKVFLTKISMNDTEIKQITHTHTTAIVAERKTLNTNTKGCSTKNT